MEKDIFDKIMELNTFNIFRPFYRKYKEQFLYLIFGGLTFFLAIAVFSVFYSCVGLNELVANIISWLSGVTFSFCTTRKWVFRAETRNLSSLFGQLVSFYMTRGMTLLLQEVLIYIFVRKFGIQTIMVKVFTEIINIVLNYLTSKFVIFRKRYI